MKSLYKKSLISSLVIMLVSISFCLTPQKAHAQAQAALAVPTSDVLNFPYHFANYTQNYILNTLINVTIKQLARQLTLSIINWINSGFKGSPSFVQNPEAFFENIGNNVAGNFIGGPGSPLAALCSPIALNIRLALALNQANLNNPYACTLSKVISNIKGATINGFSAGDFAQGGWQGFATLAEPQNSFYGGYVQAQADLAIQINGKNVLNQNLLNQGSGFLSWQSCTAVTQSQAQAQSNFAQVVAAGTPTLNTPSPFSSSFNNSNVPAAPPGSVGTYQSDPGTGAGQNCQTETPGSFISQQLNFAASSPLQQLDVADNINAIVNALFSQLVYQTLKQGLGTVSGSSAGGASSNSYLSQLETESEQNDIAIQEQAAQNISTGLSGSLETASEYKNYVDSSLSLAETASSTYATALSYCTTAGDTSVISQIESDITTKVEPLLSNLINEDATATADYENIQSFVSSSTVDASNGTLASTTFNGQSENYNTLAGGGDLITPEDVTGAESENAQVQTETTALQTSAQQYQNECQVYTENQGQTESSANNYTY